MILRDDGQLGDELGRLAREHHDIAEAGCARSLRERQCCPRIGCDDRCGAMSQGRSHGTLSAGLDLEQRECEPLAFLGERTRRRRQAFAFRQRTLERLQPLACDPRLLAQRLALGADARIEHAPRTRELGTQIVEQRLCALAAQLEPLARTAEAIERRRRLLATAGRVGELLLGAPSFLEQRVELLVRVLPCEHRGRPPSFSVLESLAQLAEVELGDASAQRRDLAPQLFRALSSRRLQGERSQALLHLCLDVARALDLDRDARELQLRPVLAPLEAAEPGRLFEQCPSLLRLRPEDLLDAALADDRVHPAAEPEIRQQLDEVDAPHGGAVEHVLALAAAVQAPRDRELGVRERPLAVRVVEEELDLAEVLGVASAAAGEDHVVRLLRAELGRRHRARRPDDRVRDVRLPRAVRAHDHGHAGLEADLDRLGERLEAAQLDGAKVHATGG